MLRPLFVLACLAAALGLAQLPGEVRAQKKEPWGTIKGRVVWGGDKVPAAVAVNVPAGLAQCLPKGGVLFDDLLVVNGQNKGIKNVVVWLAPGGNQALAIHPDLKNLKDKEVVIDQPQCLFTPRAVGLREGQILVVKNSAAFAHNVKWDGKAPINDSGNVTVPPGKSHAIKDLKAQPLPMPVSCGIHPWMAARVGIFDHPYFTVTDADGKFEIKLAPTGKVRLMAVHEKLGYHGGAKNAKTFFQNVPIADVLDVGDMKMQE